MDLNVLERVGLTKKEAGVYQILLGLGECPVIDILNRTQDHPQIVYRAIDGLEAKGLVLVSFKKHKKYVQAEDPKVLQRIEEQKMEELKVVISDLAALKKESPETIVRVSKGEEAVAAYRAKAIEIAPEGTAYCVIGGSSSRFYKALGDKLEKIERKRLKKRVIKRMILFENERELWLKNKFEQEEDVVFLPESFSIPATTCISGNTVGLQVWAKEPLMIEIENAEVAESYRKYFEIMYKMASK